MTQPTRTQAATRFVTGRFHDDGEFEPHPKNHSFATATAAQAWTDDEIGRHQDWRVYAVTEIPPDADGSSAGPPGTAEQPSEFEPVRLVHTLAPLVAAYGEACDKLNEQTNADGYLDDVPPKFWEARDDAATALAEHIATKVWPMLRSAYDV